MDFYKLGQLKAAARYNAPHEVEMQDVSPGFFYTDTTEAIVDPETRKAVRKNLSVGNSMLGGNNMYGRDRDTRFQAGYGIHGLGGALTGGALALAHSGGNPLLAGLGALGGGLLAGGLSKYQQGNKAKQNEYRQYMQNQAYHSQEPQQ